MSTPHQGCAAGIYTSPILLPLVAHILDSFGAIERVPDFVSNFGRKFYQCELTVAQTKAGVVLKRNGQSIQQSWTIGDENIVPFWAGQHLKWSIEAQD